MTDKKLINVKITEIDEHGLFCGSIDDAIKYLEKIKEIYIGSGFQDLILEINSYGYDSGYEIFLYGKRLETDKEFKDRLKKNNTKQNFVKRLKIKSKPKNSNSIRNFRRNMANYD